MCSSPSHTNPLLHLSAKLHRLSWPYGLSSYKRTKLNKYSGESRISRKNFAVFTQAQALSLWSPCAVSEELCLYFDMIRLSNCFVMIKDTMEGCCFLPPQQLIFDWWPLWKRTLPWFPDLHNPARICWSIIDTRSKELSWHLNTERGRRLLTWRHC